VRTSQFNALTTVHSGPRSLFQVLAVYEDFAAGCRANDTCSFLMTQLGDEFELRSGMWKFEILREPDFADAAAADALQADVIIVAVCGTSSLPLEVTGWIERWLPLRGERIGALIALLDGTTNPADPPPPAFSYLRKIAAAGKMEFLPNVRDCTIAEAACFDSLVTAAISFVPSDEPSPGRHWGINE
jgi:hypothetical protein